jgi:hypothetical protein
MTVSASDQTTIVLNGRMTQVHICVASECKRVMTTYCGRGEVTERRWIPDLLESKLDRAPKDGWTMSPGAYRAIR